MHIEKRHFFEILGSLIFCIVFEETAFGGRASL